ncbi:MAG: hypothetical protein IK005_06035 [Paludibacteraceae bacterium]|nr:hypothetical protein [Paludibacteraceae bacterium]
MDKEKLSIILIVAALLLPALEMTNWPGMGVILTVGLSTIAFIFPLICGRTLKFLNCKWNNPEEEDEDKNQLIDPFKPGRDEDKNQLLATELFMYMSLSILCVGILFTSQHRPGGSMQRLVGGLGTLIFAFCNIIFLNEEKCTYYFKLRTVSIAAIFLAIVGMTNYYSDFIFKTQNSDYHHLVEIYSERDGDEEQRKERNIERQKFFALDSKSYNHFDSLLTKANAMAKEDSNARVLYLLMNQISKSGDLINGVVYDKEEKHGVEVNRFATLHPEFFNNDTKLIVVTDDAEKATEKLKALSSENKEIIIVE